MRAAVGFSYILRRKLRYSLYLSRRSKSCKEKPTALVIITIIVYFIFSVKNVINLKREELYTRQRILASFKTDKFLKPYRIHILSN